MDSGPYLGDINCDYGAWYGFHDSEDYVVKALKGLRHEVVEMISRYKSEPDWMRDFRHEALDIFFSKPTPRCGNQELLGQVSFDDIHYFMKPTMGQGASWDDVPVNIKRTFDRLGIPEAERKFLAGVSAQYESEVVYHSIRKELE